MTMLYRYSDTGGVLQCESFVILRRTPRGVVVNEYGKTRFVLSDSRKRFAHETKDAALASYIARKTRQISILSSQLARAKQGLSVATASSPDTMAPYITLTGERCFDQSLMRIFG